MYINQMKNKQMQIIPDPGLVNQLTYASRTRIKYDVSKRKINYEHLQSKETNTTAAANK